MSTTPDDSWETEEATEMADEENETTDETNEERTALAFDDELVEELPPPAGSLYAEAIGRLLELAEDGSGWLGVSTGGRKPNSVQTGLQGAARTLGVKIKTRTREEDGEKKVYVALANGDDADTEETEEE